MRSVVPTMQRILLLFLCLGQAMAATSGSERVDQNPQGRVNDWRTKIPPNPNARKIGLGVHLNAHIFYESSFREQYDKRKERGVTQNLTIDGYFKALLNQVEAYFHDQSIMINIQIKEVTQKNDLTVVMADRIQWEQTLQKVTRFGNALQLTNDSIVYLYAWNEKNTEKDFIDEENFYGLGTKSTFCTQSTSAAVVHHLPGNLAIWATANLTSAIFGSEHFITFTERDRTTMEEAFSKCPAYRDVNSSDTSMPAC